MMARSPAGALHAALAIGAVVVVHSLTASVAATAAAPAPQISESCSFPVNISNYQYFGLQQATGVSSADGCAQACCDQGDACKIWQWSVGGDASPVHTCWIGDATSHQQQSGWQSFGRGIIPPPPPPTPPQEPFTIDDSPGLGMRFEGIGAISGGGATSKLLMDYDPAVAADIIDYLFKPNFGASLHMLKVEVGGDADATEGAEPSHQHFKDDAPNFDRGYEQWMMQEARKRNPRIKLYGLPWSFPGFLGNGSSHDYPSSNPFTDINATAKYTSEWVAGTYEAKRTRVDYIGLWNERSSPQQYTDTLRSMLDAEGFTDVAIASGPHYPGTGLEPADCSQYEYNESRWTDEEGSVADGQSARCLARCINRGYLTNCRNALIQWHLISSFADYLPWKRCGVAVANRPWSGYYEVTSPTWSVAHTTQFTEPGWRYLQIGSGQGFLQYGGSYASYTDGNGAYTIVVEKMDHDSSYCARGNHPSYDTSPETVTLILKGGLSKIKTMHVWYSNLTAGNDSSELFVNKGTIDVTSGQIEVQLGVDCMYTFTTVSTGNKGNHTVPADSTFPFPYFDSFDDQRETAPAKYWYDQMGAFEIQKSNDTARGMIMRHVVPDFPVCWGYSCAGPTTYLGDGSWSVTSGSNFTIDVMLENDGGWMFDAMQNGKSQASLAIDTDGSYSVAGSKSTGAAFGKNVWHTVSVAMGPQSSDGGTSWTAAYLDGLQLANITAKAGGADAASAAADGEPQLLAGMDSGGWYARVELTRYIFAQMDNVQVRGLSG